MKTLELNQMGNLQGGYSIHECKASVGLSFVVGSMLLGPMGGLLSAYMALKFGGSCN